MNIYVAVILDQNEFIVSTWAAYAYDIRQAKEFFSEVIGPLKEGYKVLFRLIKEN